MKRRVLVLIPIFVLALIPRGVYADGGIVAYDHGTWDMLDEESQYCAINYVDGAQKMLVAINTVKGVEPEQMVWLFPVPADPFEIELDVVQGFPRFAGVTVEERALGRVFLVSAIASFTQARLLTALYMGFTSDAGHTGPAGSESPTDTGGPVVYATVTKAGVTSELVSARTSPPLIQYLASRNIVLPDAFLGLLRNYMGDHYSFVVTWISDPTAYSRATAGSGDGPTALDLFLSFPTDRLYFPLKPTAVYEERTIPIVIYVNGFVTPMFPPGVGGLGLTEYYLDRRREFPETLRSFYGSDPLPRGDVEYTKIRIEAPASALNDDLWIDYRAPPSVRAATLFARWAWVAFVFAMILLMPMTAVLSALLTRDLCRLLLRDVVRRSFANCLTIVAFWVVSFIHPIRRTPATPNLEQEHRSHRLFGILRLAVVLLPAIAGACVDFFGRSGFSRITGLSLMLTCLPMLPFLIVGHIKQESTLLFCSLYSTLYMDLILFVLLGITSLIFTVA